MFLIQAPVCDSIGLNEKEGNFRENWLKTVILAIRPNGESRQLGKTDAIYAHEKENANLCRT